MDLADSGCPDVVAAIHVRAVGSAVVAEINATRHLEIPGHRVIVGVRAKLSGKRRAAVLRLAKVNPGAKNMSLIERINPEPAKPPSVARLRAGEG